MSGICDDLEGINTQILYDMVRVYELMGLSHDDAFERAFTEYKSIKGKA